MGVVGGEDDGDGCGRRGGDAMEKRENRGVDMTLMLWLLLIVAVVVVATTVVIMQNLL